MGSISAATCRVLVIDDDPDYGQMMYRRLQNHGFETCRASTGREGQAKVTEFGPNLILLDIRLPDIDGIALHRAFKIDPRTRDIPIILMTGEGYLDSVLEATVQGLHAEPVYLKVSCDVRGILERISEILERPCCQGEQTEASTGVARGASRTKVLVVEDDEDVQNIYREFFDIHGAEFRWVLSRTGDMALAALRDGSGPFDVALIDWTLKQSTKDGLQVLQAIRSNKATCDMLAFMVTGNEYERDVQAAFETGADDYIFKPFREEILLARLRGRLHRKQQEAPSEPEILELDGLKFHVSSRAVVLNGNRIDLYPTEAALLRQFLANPDRLLSPDSLWHAIRGYKSGSAGKALTIQICNLRKNLGAWGERIETLRGQGYRISTSLPIPTSQ